MQFVVVKAFTSQVSFVGSCQLMHVNMVFPVIITNKLHGDFIFLLFFFFLQFPGIPSNGLCVSLYNIFTVWKSYC